IPPNRSASKSVRQPKSYPNLGIPKYSTELLNHLKLRIIFPTLFDALHVEIIDFEPYDMIST
ncbi:MAG: hypothetical protein V4585_21840, partial [Bacteroidota bacterium]